MTDEELREAVAAKASHFRGHGWISDEAREFADQIHNLYKQACYVQLDNQSLPEQNDKKCPKYGKVCCLHQDIEGNCKCHELPRTCRELQRIVPDWQLTDVAETLYNFRNAMDITGIKNTLWQLVKQQDNRTTRYAQGRLQEG